MRLTANNGRIKTGLNNCDRGVYFHCRDFKFSSPVARPICNQFMTSNNGRIKTGLNGHFCHLNQGDLGQYFLTIPTSLRQIINGRI